MLTLTIPYDLLPTVRDALRHEAQRLRQLARVARTERSELSVSGWAGDKYPGLPMAEYARRLTADAMAIEALL